MASRDTVWRLTELISFLTKLIDLTAAEGRDDSRLKYDLYERHSLKSYLNRILFNGNSIEKEYALKLLWKMSLERRVADSIRADLNLYSFLVGLSMNEFNRNRMLIKYSNCILFALSNNNCNLNNNNGNNVSETFLRRTTSTKFPTATDVSSVCSTSRTSSFSSRLFVTEEVEFFKI